MSRRKAPVFAIPAADRDRLSKALGDTPAIMVKWFFQHRGLPQYLGASKETITDRFLGHIGTEELSLDDAYDAVRQFYEYGAKEVRLYQVDPSHLRRVPGDLREARIERLGHARIRRQPIATIVNYSHFQDGLLRISFSEKHEDLVLDVPREQFIWRPRTAIVVAHGSAKTGDLDVALDRPGRRHPHGVSAMSYYDYHLGRISDLLGTQLTPVDLRRLIERLEKGELASLSRSEGKSDTSRIRFVASGGIDVRQDPLYGKFVDERRTADAAALEWKPGPSGEEDEPPRIARIVKTKIEVRTSAVHFVQGTLEHEAEYVIEMVRANA